jgi:hypothetical protein
MHAFVRYGFSPAQALAMHSKLTSSPRSAESTRMLILVNLVSCGAATVVTASNKRCAASDLKIHHMIGIHVTTPDGSQLQQGRHLSQLDTPRLPYV